MTKRDIDGDWWYEITNNCTSSRSNVPTQRFYRRSDAEKYSVNEDGTPVLSPFLQKALKTGFARWIMVYNRLYELQVATTFKIIADGDHHFMSYKSLDI